MAISSICLMPLMALVILLFKRTAPARPELEDRWVGAPRNEIPKHILKAVQVREALLLAQRKVKRVEEERILGKRYLRETLEEFMKRAVNEGRNELSMFEEDQLILLKETLADEYKRDLTAANQRLAQAYVKFHDIRQEQSIWIHNRQLEILNGMKAANPHGGIGSKLQLFYAKHFVVKSQAKSDLALTFMSIEERAMLKAEEKQLANFGNGLFGFLKRFVYHRYLNPLRDLKGATRRTKFLPLWAVYFVHGFCLLLAGFCSYYIFLFSVMLNRCASCGPPDSMDDDDVANCSTCPDSMRNNNDPNQDIALDWLLTVLYTVAFNVFVMEPVKAGVKAAVYPMFVNWALKVNWEKYLLSGDDDEILQEVAALDLDGDIDDGLPIEESHVVKYTNEKSKENPSSTQPSSNNNNDNNKPKRKVSIRGKDSSSSPSSNGSRVSPPPPLELSSGSDPSMSATSGSEEDGGGVKRRSSSIETKLKKKRSRRSSRFEKEISMNEEVSFFFFISTFFLINHTINQYH
jgi:hypothetical protein